MRELVNRSLQSCHLTVFHAGRVMVVAEVDSPERWAFGLKVGAQVGLTDTASGYVLLAFQDEAGRRAMLASHQKVEGELSRRLEDAEKEVHERWQEFQRRCQAEQARHLTEAQRHVATSGTAPEPSADAEAAAQVRSVFRDCLVQRLEPSNDS